MCKSICELIFGIIIVVLALWPTILGASASMWVTIVVGAFLIIHSFTCKSCFAGMPAKKR